MGDEAVSGEWCYSAAHWVLLVEEVQGGGGDFRWAGPGRAGPLFGFQPWHVCVGLSRVR